VVALLDVSILIALFDADHVHHQVAHDWFQDQRASGWATCPMTENGFIRIATNRLLFDPPKQTAEAIAELTAFCESGHHQFWPDSVSLVDKRTFAAPMIRGPKQVADIYLLGLATARNGVFATLDRSVPLNAVKGATRSNLIVLGAPPETADDR